MTETAPHPNGALADRCQTLAAGLRARHPAAARLAWLVERARQRPPLPDPLRTDDRLLPGCLSRLWLVTELSEGRCRFRCDSDAEVVRAVAGALCELLDGLAPAEALAADPDLPARLGLDRLLTLNRRAAQSRVWETLRAFAARHAAPAGPGTGPHPPIDTDGRA